MGRMGLKQTKHDQLCGPSVSESLALIELHPPDNTAAQFLDVLDDRGFLYLKVIRKYSLKPM